MLIQYSIQATVLTIQLAAKRIDLASEQAKDRQILPTFE